MTLVYLRPSSARAMVKHSSNSWTDVRRIDVFYLMDHTAILM